VQIPGLGKTFAAAWACEGDGRDSEVGLRKAG
jgi:hypothetical protein